MMEQMNIPKFACNCLYVHRTEFEHLHLSFKRFKSLRNDANWTGGAYNQYWHRQAHQSTAPGMCSKN